MCALTFKSGEKQIGHENKKQDVEIEPQGEEWTYTYSLLIFCSVFV